MALKMTDPRSDSSCSYVLGANISVRQESIIIPILMIVSAGLFYRLQVVNVFVFTMVVTSQMGSRSRCLCMLARSISPL